MSETSPYDVIAPAYDVMTAGYPHDEWLAAIERLAIERGLCGRRVLDVACGTGKSFEPLLRRGYDVTACDASPAMAARARTRGGPDVRVSVADMRRLPVLGSFDLITCLDDGLNHLVEPDDVQASLRRMRANLARKGLIVFDVSLFSAYAGAVDAIVDGGVHVVLWRGSGARLSRPGTTGDIVVDVFSARADGLWARAQMRQRHRHYPVATLRRLAAEAGLRVDTIVGQRAGGRLRDDLDEAQDRKALFVLTHPHTHH
jgi:SAM-dependent methyltransferase